MGSRPGADGTRYAAITPEEAEVNRDALLADCPRCVAGVRSVCRTVPTVGGQPAIGQAADQAQVVSYFGSGERDEDR